MPITVGPPAQNNGDAGETVSSYAFTFERPTRLVVVRLVAAAALGERRLVVSLADPARPGEPVVHGSGAWRFSQTLHRDFVYAPQIDAGAIWTLPPASTPTSISSLSIQVHPWGGARTTQGLLSQVWVSAVSDVDDVRIYRMGSA